jgi:hypothetical protein
MVVLIDCHNWGNFLMMTGKRSKRTAIKVSYEVVLDDKDDDDDDDDDNNNNNNKNNTNKLNIKM